MYTKYIELLKKKLVYINTTSTKNAVFRCPFCGDSQKSPHKGHLYVSEINGLFNCFRCDEKGFITKLIKHVLGISTYYSARKELDKFYKKIKQQGILNKYENEYLPFSSLLNKNLIDNYWYTEITDYNSPVVQYVNHRTGFLSKLDKFIEMNRNHQLILFSYIEYFLNSKINIKDEKRNLFFKNTFLNNNNNFIWTSFFKNKVYVRNFTNSNKRYYFVHSFQNRKDFPIIIENKKLLLKNKINVWVAEGIFDILNLFLYYDNIFDKKHHPDILVCLGGKKSLYSAIDFIYKTFMIPMNCYIFLDQDNSDKKVIKNISTFLKNKLYVMSSSFLVNKKSKDYGEISEGLVPQFI